MKGSVHKDTKLADESRRYSDAMWTEIEECNPEINLYITFFSLHHSSEGSGKEKFRDKKYSTS